MTKEKIIAAMDGLPSDFSVDELIEKVIFIDKIEKGISQSNKGNTLSTDEAKARLGKWLK
jgi:hypothetical protein